VRITLFIDSLAGGGAERSCTRLANQLTGRGWEVTVMTYDPPSNDWYPLDQAVIRKVASRPFASSKAKRKKPKPWYPNRYVVQFRFLYSLRASLRTTRPDVVLSFFPWNNVTVGVSLLGSGIPVVVSERGHTALRPVSARLGFLRQLMYPRMSAVIAVSEQSSQWIRDNTRAKRVVTIPNAVELPLPVGGMTIEPEPPTDGRLGEKTLLAAGRLVPIKGFNRLLDAFAGLGEDGQGWRLVILGEGPDRSDLGRQIHELGLDERVHMPGAVGNMADWYLAADLFVMTSTSEGFPNVLIEALAHDCAVVAFDSGGPSEIIRDGTDGYLVPQDDMIGLVSALRNLMTDDALRARFASRAGEARDRFAVPAMVARYEAVLIHATR
jgi:glycosyltransferase involved in cell wall biosynthesis